MFINEKRVLKFPSGVRKMIPQNPQLKEIQLADNNTIRLENLTNKELAETVHTFFEQSTARTYPAEELEGTNDYKIFLNQKQTGNLINFINTYTSNKVMQEHKYLKNIKVNGQSIKPEETATGLLREFYFQSAMSQLTTGKSFIQKETPQAIILSQEGIAYLASATKQNTIKPAAFTDYNASSTNVPSSIDAEVAEIFLEATNTVQPLSINSAIDRGYSLEVLGPKTLKKLSKTEAERNKPADLVKTSLLEDNVGFSEHTKGHAKYILGE